MRTGELRNPAMPATDYESRVDTRPPLMPLSLAISFRLFGPHPAVARAGEFLAALPALFLVYGIGREIVGDPLAGASQPGRLTARRRRRGFVILDGFRPSAMLQAESNDGKSVRLTFGNLKFFMSQALVKLQRKGQMVIPRALRQEAGVPEGTLMKVDVVKNGQFLVTAQFTLDRPVVEGKNRKAVFRELAQVVDELRQEAKAKGIDKMSKAQINAAVAAARRDLNKSSKRPAK